MSFFLQQCAKSTQYLLKLHNFMNVNSYVKISSCIFLHQRKADTLVRYYSQGFRNVNEVQDYNFSFFRNNDVYKTSAVQIDRNAGNCIVSGCEFEYFFEGDVKIDALMRYLAVRENVMKLSSSQVKDMMRVLVNLEVQFESFPLVFKWLDEKCAVSVAKWPLDLTLYILDAWYLILGHKAFKKHYFSTIMNLLHIKVKGFTKNHVIQILYFVGLAKISPPFLMFSLEAKLEKLRSEISDVEWAIACVSFFKTSTKMKSELVLSKTCAVAKNLIAADERFHLTSVLKSLRQAHYYDEKLICALQEYVCNNFTKFNFVECSSFVAAFSAHNIYHKEIFECIEKQSVGLILEDAKMMSSATQITPSIHPAIHFRVKDLARLLWAMVCVGHEPQSATINAVLNCIQQRLNNGEYRKQSHVLLDTLHSLAIANCYPQDILTQVLNSKFLEHIWNVPLDKPKYQFFFLYKSTEIESPESITDKTLDKKVLRLLNPIPKSIIKEKNERSGFIQLNNLFATDFKGLANVECSFVIPHIVIGGFLIKNPKTLLANLKLHAEKCETFSGNLDVKYNEECSKHIYSAAATQKDDIHLLCIEVLDETVCVKNTSQPLGLMKAKVRQLEKLLYEVVLLTPKEIQELKTLPKLEKFKKMSQWINKGTA